MLTLSDAAADALAGGHAAENGARDAGSFANELPPFATVQIAERPEIRLAGDGDLWPTCWSDDGHLYTAWGDGHGFGGPFIDIGVARIKGSPAAGDLAGENLAVGDAVGQVWTTTGGYNRKPTGIACVDGDLYLAVQDLAHDFNDAPAATIARSRDKGRTWEWNRSAPMFRDHELTTIFFLDAGQDTPATPAPFVYAYALDGNWRDSFTDRVPDPTRVWLARIPRDALQEATRWEWYAGADEQGVPGWVADPQRRAAILLDERRLYRRTTADGQKNISNFSVISQGGVVYDAPLRRYLYTSWTEFTWEFYEAPTPWGPWRHFLSKDFGGYPWSLSKSGGYATSIPSKFISLDGRRMYVQSNTWFGGVDNYGFSLRSLQVELPLTLAHGVVAGEPIPLRGSGAVPIASNFRLGRPEVLSDGDTLTSEDSRTGELRDEDYWGYVWPRPYALTRLTYTPGGTAGCSWSSPPTVEVRNGASWGPVTSLEVEPPYSIRASDSDQTTYVFSFAAVVADGVRLRGTPGGEGACSSIAELSVQYIAP